MLLNAETQSSRSELGFNHPTHAVLKDEILNTNSTFYPLQTS